MRLFFASFLLSATLSLASYMQYTVSGAFGAAAPLTTLSAPNASFTLTMQVTTPVIPVGTGPNTFFTTSSGTFQFGSSTVPFSNSDTAFYAAVNDGGFDLTIVQGTDQLFLSFAAAQLFTGTVDSPTLVVGSFPINYSSANTRLQLNGTDDGNIQNSGASIVATAVVDSVPEPSSLALAGAGLLAAVLYKRKRT